MAGNASRPARLAGMAALAALGWLAILIGLAPIDARAAAWPAPDLLFGVVACFAVRRPSSSPAALILVLGLARDVLGGGPAGLGALTLWAAAEYLRFHRDRFIRSPLAEAGALAALSLLLPFAHLVAMTALFAPSPPLSVLALGAISTFAAALAVRVLLVHLLRIGGEAVENHRLIGRAR